MSHQNNGDYTQPMYPNQAYPQLAPVGGPQQQPVPG